jgi:hypothetical protein
MKDKILMNLTKVGFPSTKFLQSINMTIEESYIEVYGQTKCRICGDISRFISFNKGYAEYCGKKCSQKHKWTKESKESGDIARKEYYKTEEYLLRNKNISDTNKEVWKSGTLLRNEQTKAHIKTKRQNRLKLNLSDIDLYYRLVYSYTNKNELTQLDNFEKRGRTGVHSYHLDHKYSIRSGFENNILPMYIGNINNLEMLLCFENNSKGKKCSITEVELCENFIC